MSKFFDELMESVQEMGEIVRVERQPSREFNVDALQVKETHKATGLTQARFSALIRPTRHAAQLGAEPSRTDSAGQSPAESHNVDPTPYMGTIKHS